MEKPIITSLGKEPKRQARALHQKKARSESGLFLVEVIHHVGKAFALFRSDQKAWAVALAVILALHYAASDNRVLWLLLER